MLAWVPPCYVCGVDQASAKFLIKRYHGWYTPAEIYRRAICQALTQAALRHPQWATRNGPFRPPLHAWRGSASASTRTGVGRRNVAAGTHASLRLRCGRAVRLDACVGCMCCLYTARVCLCGSRRNVLHVCHLVSRCLLLGPSGCCVCLCSGVGVRVAASARAVR